VGQKETTDLGDATVTADSGVHRKNEESLEQLKMDSWERKLLCVCVCSIRPPNGGTQNYKISSTKMTTQTPSQETSGRREQDNLWSDLVTG